MKILKIKPTSMIDRQGMQRIDVWLENPVPFHGMVRVWWEGKVICSTSIAASSGKNHCVVMLPEPDVDRYVQWQLCDSGGRIIDMVSALWPKPRHWKLYFVVSSHTDIGLHNSQYIQRFNSCRFIERAMKLCDATENRKEENRYHYVMEGTWFWENYARDHGKVAARRIVDNYIHSKKLGLCVGIAGNHTQVFGLEEMCRAAQELRRTRETWSIQSHTLSMIDNNGLSWGMVQPFAEAGYRNILFAPNQWNPLESTVWHMDGDVQGAIWNPEAGGGGSRIDMRFNSALPRLFYWESADAQHRLLVWSGGNYGFGGSVFGLMPDSQPSPLQLRKMEECTARQLSMMEEKYPYDLWLTACYNDDQAPEMGLTDCIAEWNARWAWPRFSTVGDIDDPFEELRSRFDAEIPIIRGELAGGWYQHPLSTAELLADKFRADRLLPVAETLSALACLSDPSHLYPAEDFNRAWNALLWNDEHSYGTSGYQGRRVYETWMQHRAWIEEATHIARTEIHAAMQAIGRKIPAHSPSILVFNSTAQVRSEWVSLPDGRSAWVEQIPSVGYKVLPETAFLGSHDEIIDVQEPPTIENQWYRLALRPDGSIHSIFDKELGKELVDPSSRWGANSFVYTRDNHKNYFSPKSARFSVCKSAAGICVTIVSSESASRAAITTKLTLSNHEKSIQIDNQLDHVHDLFNNNRYYRYAYFAFPFLLAEARRFCHLNGCVAEYGVDVTGHGTDTYMAANEWCCAEDGEIGIGMVQLDSLLVEFDHIHPDKTDFGNPGSGAGMYFYLANDWLQMHVSGGDELNFHFRYAITSYRGTYRSAGLPEFAERCANPLLVERIYRGDGSLPAEKSFLQTSRGVRFLCLKQPFDGNGLIAHLYSLISQQQHGLTFGTYSIERNSLAEEPIKDSEWQGFEALRIGAGCIRLSIRAHSAPGHTGTRNTPIGSCYTGLINHPRAARGEMNGQLYLLWGAVEEADLYGYKVYRGLEPDFVADASSLIAEVKPEQYCVGRYCDMGLARNTRYYYRVCAFDRDGACGPMSDVFSARTKA